jgi:hypothetical protein
MEKKGMGNPAFLHRSLEDGKRFVLTVYPLEKHSLTS